MFHAWKRLAQLAGSSQYLPWQAPCRALPSRWPEVRHLFLCETHCLVRGQAVQVFPENRTPKAVLIACHAPSDDRGVGLFTEQSNGVRLVAALPRVEVGREGH